MKTRLLALTLALSLLLSSCGGGATAAAMRLMKTEGTVGVSDGAGKDVESRDGLGLYSGYGVDTQAESYAWIDLDEVKLTKLDENSQIAIQKDGKALEIEVLSGSLFFNVTQPLAVDEAMTIRSAAMAVGIRGTCGWVTTDAVYILEGTVEVTAGENTAAVNAGEMANMTADGDIQVKPFISAAVPEFIRAELNEDEELTKRIKEASGIDPSGPASAGAQTYSHMRSTTYSIDGTPSSSTEVFYAPDGLSYQQVHYDFTDGRQDQISQSENIRDERGILLESKRFVNNELYSTYRLEEETAAHRIYRTYNAEGQLLGESIYYLDEQGSPVSSEDTTYNLDGTISCRQSLSFNEHGDIIQNTSQFFDSYGSISQNNSTMENTYDDQGRLSRIDTYTEDGTLYGYIIYEYD